MGRLVTVELNGGSVCQIAHEALELLLTHNEITKIKRSNGWAVVGHDRLRNEGKGVVLSIRPAEKRGERGCPQHS